MNRVDRNGLYWQYNTTQHISVELGGTQTAGLMRMEVSTPGLSSLTDTLVPALVTAQAAVFDDLAWTVIGGRVVRTSTFDAFNHLQATDERVGGSPTAHTEFAYDDAGNLLTQGTSTGGGPVATTGYLYDELDRLTAVTLNAAPVATM